MDKYIGKKLDGRYEIKELIGIGGMAMVYTAYDPIDDRTVAVKILKEEYWENEEFRRRFKNESKAVAVLSHPNIVQVFDVNYTDKMQYIVMEYIDGITLKDYIEQEGTVNWKEVVHFTSQILKALQHAHEKGVVHRDIKPQNIMLLQDGTIKVTDFGIAHFSNNDQRTMTDKAIGSVHYISPEQARGEITDGKTDIYSVGVMMYEMLTGRLPFTAENPVSVAIMQMDAAPIKPREINPDIPEGLEDITIRAMQKNAVNRYQSAEEMQADIELFKQNPSIHFEYKYFSDDAPTKYVDAIEKVKKENGEDDEKSVRAFKILVGIAAGFVVAAIGFITWILISNFWPSANAKTIDIPNLVGRSYDEVLNDRTVTSNFDIVLDNKSYNEQYPEGQIFDQDPSGGTAKKGSQIKVKVSEGTRTAMVPAVAGSDKTTARGKLINAGFQITEVMINDEVVAKDVIIKADPAEGQMAPYGSTIKLYISLGRINPNVKVPDVIGQTVDAAKASLLIAGNFTVSSVTAVDSDKPRGTVVGVEPGVGSSILSGSTVVLKVSNDTTKIKIDLPNPPSKASSYPVTVFLNGTQLPGYPVNVRAGQTGWEFSVTSTGQGHVVIMIGNWTFADINVDFDQKTYTPTKHATP